jgi:hypothetical protein
MSSRCDKSTEIPGSKVTFLSVYIVAIIMPSFKHHLLKINGKKGSGIE